MAVVYRQGDSSDVVLGQAVRQLRPGSSRICRLENATLGSASDHLADAAAPLVRGGVKDVGILRVKDGVTDTGVRADRQHGVPRPATIGGLVQPALASGGPERSLCCDVNRSEEHT